MGRHELYEYPERLGPKVWSRFLLHRFGCVAPEGLDLLDAQLPVPITHDERFEFGVSPPPLERVLRRDVFRAAFEKGHNPDGFYLVDEDESAKFNLFARVTRRVPESAPWLLQGITPYNARECPPIDHAIDVCEAAFDDLGITLVPFRCIAPWVRADEAGTGLAERTSLESLVNLAHPSALATLVALNHLLAWNQAAWRVRAQVERRCVESAHRLASAFVELGFDDGARLGDELVESGRSAILGIQRYGARSMMSRARAREWDWSSSVPSHVIFVPENPDVRDALFCLHAGSEVWFETIGDPVPPRYFFDSRLPTAEALRDAAGVVRDAACSLDAHMANALAHLARGGRGHTHHSDSRFKQPRKKSSARSR